jgi:acyl-CoA thioester hydrolase
MLSKKIDIRVYYEDTDSGGIVYYANYFKFTERCRTELLREIGLSQTEILNNYDLKFIVHSVSMDYINSSGLDDKLTVETTIDSLNNASILFNQSIYKFFNGQKIDIIKSKCKIVCIDSKSKVKPIPKLILDKIREEE